MSPPPTEMSSDRHPHPRTPVRRPPRRPAQQHPGQPRHRHHSRRGRGAADRARDRPGTRGRPHPRPLPPRPGRPPPDHRLGRPDLRSRTPRTRRTGHRRRPVAADRFYPTGTGKTYQAYGAVRALLSRGVRLRWEVTTTADLYARLRPRNGHDAERDLQTLARCPLLLLDDLGAAKTSEWTEELTYRLINHRYEHMLPTLITTNLPIPELRTALGDRVASRLAEMTERIVLTGPDRRRRTPPVA